MQQTLIVLVVAVMVLLLATMGEAQEQEQHESAHNLRGAALEEQQSTRNLGGSTFYYGWGYFTSSICPASYYDSYGLADGTCHQLSTIGEPLSYPTTSGLIKSYKGDCAESGKVIFYSDTLCTQVVTQLADACVHTFPDTIRFCCGANCLNAGFNLK